MPGTQHASGSGARPCQPRLQLFGHVLVELRKALEIAFGVARRDARGAAGGGAGAGAAARDQPRRLAQRREPQLVRVLLAEGQPGLAAVDAHAQRVLVARCDLARPQHALRTFGVAQQHMGVVVQPPARHEGVEVGADLGQIEADDEPRQVLGMRADVAQRPAGAGLRRIDAPSRLLLTRRLQIGAEPVLRVFGLHHADLAQFTGGDHLARLAHHRVAAVVVRQCEQLAAAPDHFGQRQRVGQVAGQRLVADDVDAGLQEGRGDARVQMVRRDDRDHVDAVLALRLGLGHRGEVGVGALRRDVQLGRAGRGARSRPTTAHRPPVRRHRRCAPPCGARRR